MQEYAKPHKNIFWILLILTGLLMLLAAGLFLLQKPSGKLISPQANITPSPTSIPTPLKEFTFKSIQNRLPEPSPITIESITLETENFTQKTFSYYTLGKKMTGQLHIPTTPLPSTGYPVILMLRGFVDKDIYTTGIGTKNAAAVFAQNGFITIAPDQLGYGGSDEEDFDSFAARVKRPVNMLNLIASIGSIAKADPQKIGIWGHSNGGQIAISLLEITQKPYPTSLWAPVSKPFPYSILYYTDEYEDEGKALRRELAKFEAIYDVEEYSISKYFNAIQAPIILHQGTNDDAIPLEWSRELYQTLENQELDITLHTYEGADHNMRPSWDLVIRRDVAFFSKQL